MALDDDNGASTDATAEDIVRSDLTAEDEAMLDQVAEVAGRQALDEFDGEVEFTKDVVVDGGRYSMTVVVTMEALEA